MTQRLDVLGTEPLGVRIRRRQGFTAGIRPAASRRWPRWLAWSLWALVIPGLVALVRLDHLLRQAGRPDLTPLTADAIGLVVGIVTAASVGAVTASRRPRHPVGWLLLGLAVSLLASGVGTGYATYGLLARPGALPAADYVAVYPSNIAIVLTAASLGFILLLTPTGRLPSPRWRWWGRVAVAAPVVGLVSGLVGPLDQPFTSVANPLAVPGLVGPLGVVGLAALAVTGLEIPVAAWSLVGRFRRATGLERLQLRWLALAGGATVVAVLVLVTLLLAGIRDPVVLGWILGACVVLLPLATGAAIMRYRLYDIDRIINRTLVYGALTAILGGAYVLIVTLTSTVLQGSAIVTAAATLTAAALFRPLRGRIQGFIDRRFYRRKYDAARTLEDFSALLRDEVDLERMRAGLMAVVRTTMEPAHASLWLKQR